MKAMDRASWEDAITGFWSGRRTFRKALFIKNPPAGIGFPGPGQLTSL
jgi:hypothetical protein